MEKIGQTGDSYDAVVIGSGLGGLTAAALMAKAGRRVLVLERWRSLGGCASRYRIGDLTIEPSLHETADPRDPRDLKHAPLRALGLLDAVDWLPLPSLHEIRGGPIPGDAPFTLPHGFDAAAAAIAERMPRAAAGTGRLLGRMKRFYDALGDLSAARDGPGGPSAGKALAAGARLAPHLARWRLSLAEAFERDLGGDEGPKAALAANLPYYADDPRNTWWLLFAAAQGGYLGSGGVYIRGGSFTLSKALARAVRRAGGDVRIGRRAIAIGLDGAGRTASVTHVDGADGGDRETTPCASILANCAPSIAADLLPAEAGRRLTSAYAGLRPSISLFTAHFGLTADPAALGLTAYSTVLLPDWMTALQDYARAGRLLSEAPDRRLPPLTVVNYGAVRSELNAPGKTLVSVVGVDRAGNWAGAKSDEEAERRAAWLDAIKTALDAAYPGFAGAVAESQFLTARSIAGFLGTPDGACYGFAPEPPRRSYWAGYPRSPKTPVPGLLLASSFGGSGGFTGAIGAGASAARLALA